MKTPTQEFLGIPLMPSEMTKRALDIAVAFAALVILSPVLLLAGIAVVTTSSGGVIFRQTRVGRHGVAFTLLKFRSMTTARADSTPGFTPGQTARVTKVGGFLRKTKLDELPQLWNVLVGDMSLVGPRPEVPEWTKVYPERWEVVLSVRPGITDPASIMFRDEEALLARAPDPTECYRNEILPRKLDLAAKYATNHTLLGDITIILRTALAIVRPASSESSADECGE
jgi:lipopolysaccharide/colanic/teichoic acid biosynthesis glycosyltransferase